LISIRRRAPRHVFQDQPNNQQTKQRKEQFMKIRDISLVAFGAIAAVSVMVAASVIFYTPRAQAQASSAAPAPGGVSLIVSPGNTAAGSAGSIQGGTIVLQDSVNRKVTIAPYAFNISSSTVTPPSILVGAISTINY